jgi:hypothetical protein
LIPLARLALRRALGPGTLVPLLALLVLAVFASWSPPAELPLPETEGRALGRALARRGVWIVGLAALLGLLVWRATALVARWRRAEGDWVGQRARGRMAALFAAALGLWAATAVAALLVAAAAELAASRYPAAEGPAMRLARTLRGPELILQPGDAPQARPIDDPRGLLRAGTRVRAELVALPGAGPAVHATLALAREGGAREERTAVVSGRGDLVVPVPPGEGRLELVLSRPATGAGLALPSGGLSLLEPARGEREAGLALLLRALALLFAATVVALGLAAWTAPATAAVGTWSLLLPLFAAGTRAPLPGADLPTALAVAGTGIAPALPSSATLLGLVAIAAAALAMGAAGLADWRRA